VQQATAVSLAQLAPTGPELKSIFVEKPGLDILCDLVTDETATASESPCVVQPSLEMCLSLLPRALEMCLFKW
jgi:hypothetical protein